MVIDPVPVQVEGVVETKPAGGTEASKPPTVEKVTETKETVKSSGEAILQPPPPTAAADDRIRAIIGCVIILQFIALIVYMIYIGKKLDDTQLILGAEIGFVTTVLNYFFGSSSGSTSKEALLSAKKL